MKKSFLISLLQNWLLIALGVLIAAHVVDGITYDSGWTLFIAVILLSAFNAFIKPILVLFTLPLIILTFGIGLWFINALLFMFVSKLVSGFEVASFSAAMWGSLIVSIVAIVVNLILGSRKDKNPPSSPQGGNKIDKDDVIDI